MFHKHLSWAPPCSVFILSTQRLLRLRYILVRQLMWWHTLLPLALCLPLALLLLLILGSGG